MNRLLESQVLYSMKNKKKKKKKKRILLGAFKFKIFHWINLYNSLDKFSRRQINDILLFFFLGKYIWQFMQIAWDIKSNFIEKFQKNISKCRLLEKFSQHAKR